MKLRFSIKLMAYALTDMFFHWLSWVLAVFIFTYLFVLEPEFRQVDIAVVNAHIVHTAIVSFLFFFVCGVYKSLWSHSGIGTMLRIMTATFFAAFSVYVSIRLHLGFWINPGIGVMAFYFFLTASLAPRMYLRVVEIVLSYLRNYVRLLPKKAEDNAIRTLLIGAGDSASTMLLHSSQQGQGGRRRKIIGILDNDKRKHGYSLHGATILGGDDMIPHLVKEHNIDEIIVAVPSLKNDDLRRIVRLTPTKHCKVRLLSGLSAQSQANMLREVNISDLLGRTETALDTAKLNTWISGKVVLVTGGGGSIGSELCRQLLQLNVDKIIVYEISENNAHNLKEEMKVKFGQAGKYKIAIRMGSIQDSARLDQVFAEFKPSVIFHAAAYKHVPLMEECPRLAIDNNVMGTYLTARAAIAHGVERFVMISTDKAVNPTNVMGASKRMAELITLGLNGNTTTEFVCVRFGNVLDSNGSVIPIFRRQIEAGGPVTVMHPEIIRYFMTISEASRLVLEAGCMAKGGEIFILDMGEQIKIVDLAENLIRIAGLTPDVDIKIDFVGLRPGEKLYEELLLDEEGLTQTNHDKIFVVKPSHSQLQAELLGWVDKKACDIISHMDADDVRDTIKHFVPEYKML